MDLVSCIMPTRNRRQFAAQAIWYFLRQDYTQRELIILDDGEDAIHDLVPPDDRIRYVRMAPGVPVGTKRRVGCEMARGEFVAYWDDDDWIGPDRLSRQVEALRDGQADACGIADLLHYRLQAGEARLFRAAPNALPAPGTLVYRRETWVEQGGAEAGNGATFLNQLAPERIRRLPNAAFYVAVLHRGNVGSRDLADPRWEVRPFTEVVHWLGTDLEFYAGLRNMADGLAPIRPGERRGVAGQALTVIAPVNQTSGYGSMAAYLIMSMARAGTVLDIRPIGLHLDGMHPEFVALYRRSRPVPAAPLLYYHFLGDGLHGQARHPELFIYTMWEADRMPESWLAELACARAIIVPSRFCARACRDSGITVPVVAVPEGVDPEIYHYEERPERQGLTTLMVCPVIRRKNTHIGIEAWKRVFAGDPDARLIIKTNYNYHNYTPDDPRILYVDRDERTGGIATWYRQADVVMALGSEGFGLPLVEAMATGLPVIALNSEGQADLIEEAGDLLLPVPAARREPYDWSPFGRSGMRGVPAADEVAAQLRWVVEHRDEARAMGRAASAWVLEHRTVWSRGPAVLDAIETHLAAPRPLRRRRAVWVSSWGTACGIAEYTGFLAGKLHDVQVTAQAPEPRHARTIHIQHEHQIYNELALTRYVEQVRAAGVPVIVTEHSVLPTAAAWERDTTVLVALTALGERRLQARWPGKRIELMPCGCPTWFPARKARPGRTLAAFGFLERHKGFFRLLDVLRALPGTDLLLYSYARSPELEARWEEASRGLPVRRIRDYLPAEEVARHLAAEADVLAFWYDDVGIAAASAAARIGLATGVPVLTSPTSWFEDLRDVTYQPDDPVEGVRRLLEDSALRQHLSGAAQEFCHQHRWTAVAERHLALWKEVESS